MIKNHMNELHSYKYYNFFSYVKKANKQLFN